MQKYKIIKVLGDGAFGTVYKAVNTKTNEVVAIKKMKAKYHSWEECLQLRQIKSLRKLSHPTIIKLKEVLLVSEQLHMVFEYLETNLYEDYSARKKEQRPFSEREVKNILFQLATSLAHMHKNGFFHRDLKPENLLVSQNILKICDFGLAREIRSRPPFTDYVSTRWYRAPELLLRSTNYNSPVDVFAFGCIAAELYNLSPLFPGSNDVDQLNRMVKILGTPDVGEWAEGYKMAKKLGYNFPNQIGVNLYELIPTASEEALDLIQNALNYSSRKRMTMSEILKHDYFKGMKLISEEEEEKPKEIVFQEKREGAVLDTAKQEKKMEEFRMTKQLFRQTRRQDALQSDPLKLLQKHHQHQKEEGVDDLDLLIKELEEKKFKDRASHREVKPIKLPTKHTREKFYTEIETKRQYQYDYKQKNHLPKTEKMDEGSKKSYNFEGDYKKQGKKEVKNVFAYGFQPASLPSLTPPLYVDRSHSISPVLASKGRSPLYFSTNNNPSKEGADKLYKPKALSPMIMPFRY